MKITIASHTVLYNNPSNPPALARVYCNELFVNEDGQTVFVGSVDGSNYVKQVEVTNSEAGALIAAFDGDNQIDSSVDENGVTESTYALTLHDANGRHLATLYETLRIPRTPTSTTWAAIVLFNNAHPQPPRHEYYDTIQVNRLIEGLEVSLAEDIDDTVSEALATAVLLTGNQTVNGVKTFNSSPVVPEPTTDLQVATKKYVDDHGGGGVLGSMYFVAQELQHIECGRFFRSLGRYSHCFWEAWVKPSALQTSAGYIISDSHGGNHNILWGVQPAGVGLFEVTGNMTTQAVAAVVSAVDTGTDAFTSVAHGLYTGARVTISSTGAVPDPLSSAVVYYVLKVDANTFRLCASMADAVATIPTYINITSAGSGVITVTTAYLTTFGSTEKYPHGHWIHLAVGWDGDKILSWVNGILVQALPFAPAYRFNGGGNDAKLHLSGSDHNNFGGNIAWVRGFEGYGRCIQRSDFSPDLFPRPLLVASGDGPTNVPQFCMSLQVKQSLYIDVGEFEGTPHHGVPSAVQSTSNESSVGYGLSLPVWQPGEIETGTYDPVAPATPVGAIVWDSFSRPDRNSVSPDPTDINSAYYLGQTEVGDKTWVRLDTGLQSTGAGVLNGRAFIVNAAPDYGVDCETQDVDVRVDRRPTFDCWTGLVFRYKDANDNYKITASDTTITVFKVEGGVPTAVAYTVPAGWTTLRVTAVGTTFNIYTGTATEGVFTLAGTFVGTDVAGATFAGITRPNGVTIPVYYDNFLIK